MKLLKSSSKTFRRFRSSVANDVFKPIYGSFVPVLKGEKFSLRILVSYKRVLSFIHIHIGDLNTESFIHLSFVVGSSRLIIQLWKVLLKVGEVASHQESIRRKRSMALLGYSYSTMLRIQM